MTPVGRGSNKYRRQDTPELDHHSKRPTNTTNVHLFGIFSLRWCQYYLCIHKSQTRLKYWTVLCRMQKPQIWKRTYRPGSEQIDQEVPTKARGKHLGYDVQIGDQRRLQDDGNVGGVEELDGVGVVLATVAGGFDWQIHSESL